MLPEPILSAAEQGRLMVFAGAGISKDPPSRLPDWFGFNRMILEGIQRAALEVLPDCEEAIRKLDMGSFPVTVFSDIIVSTFAGESYFPVLKILDSDAPNCHHQALGQLAQRNRLAAIFTTNFDTLIEQAFDASATPLRLFVGVDDFTSVYVAPPCALFKIHGSVKLTSTLVDTVSQKLRGLPPFVRHALANLDPDFPVLVIGFSGADLDFDADYIPLFGAGRHVTWIANPGRQPAPRVRAKLAETGGELVFATLGEVFAELGVTPPSVALEALRPDQDLEAPARRVIDDFLHEPHIGPLCCACVCAEMLQAVGEPGAARSIVAELRRRMEATTEFPVAARKAFRVLSTFAMYDSEFDAAISWSRRELSMSAALTEMRSRKGVSASPEARAEGLKNDAAALINIGVALRIKGETEQAREVLEVALAYAVDAGSAYHLSKVEFNLAELATHPDAAIDHARRAASYAKREGHAAALTEALLHTAMTLLKMGEYSAAAKELVAADQSVRLSAQRAYTIEILCLRGMLAARRARETDALRHFQEALQFAGGDDRARSVVARRAAESLCHFNDALPWLREVGFAIDEPVPLPYFLGIEPVGVRPQLRYALVRSEYGRDAGRCARLLLALAREGSIYQQPRRLRDLADAALEATSSADGTLVGEAWNLLGVAADLLGELDEATAAYRKAIEALADPDLKAQSRMNLALVISRHGSEADADALFAQAREEMESGPVDDRIRLDINWARHRFRHGRQDASEIAQRAQRLAEESGNVAAINASLQLMAEIAPGRPQLAGADAVELAPPQLGNMGLKMLEQGDVSGARQLITRAMEGYEANGDDAGVSRCLNNLADCAQVESKLHEAIEFSLRALDLKRKIGDTGGEALTRASLAFALVKAQAAEAALQHAERALLLVQDRLHSRPAVIAETAMAVALTLLGRGIEGRAAARRALDKITAQGDRSLEPLRLLLDPLALEQPGPERKNSQVQLTRLQTLLRELAAIRRPDQYDRALTLVAEAQEIANLDRGDLGRIAGDHANVLQRIGRDEEAVGKYEEAAQHLRAVGNDELAQMAIVQGAVSLRRSGNIALSEEWLEAIVGDPASTAIGIQARIALAKSIALPFLVGEQQVTADDVRWAKAYRLATEVDTQEMDEEMLGHVLLTSAQFRKVAGEDAAARDELERAHRVFLRFNSPHAAAVEAQLKSWEE